jgi:glycosyltransferase involved in cell wall biosynthesis
MGGAEKILLGTVNGLEHFENHVIYLNEPDTFASRFYNGCSILNLHFKGPSDIFHCSRRLKNYILENDIDIVHSHLPLSTLIARIACRRNISLFTTVHSLAGKNYYANSFLLRQMEKFFYKKEHVIIGVSREVLADYDRVIGLKGKSIVLNNFVEDKFFASYPAQVKKKGRLRLVAVGNLKKAKNYHYLIESFRNLPDNISLDIYGSGPLENELGEKIDRYKVNIRLCGTETELEKILPRYDAFIMSSFYEGHPVSLIEAMAVGLPVILADIPVLREATDNKALFFSLSDKQALHKLLPEIAEDRISLTSFREYNRARVKEIADKTFYIEKLLSIYGISLPDSAGGLPQTLITSPSYPATG